MAVHTLCSAFRRLALNKQGAIITRLASTEAAVSTFHRTNLPVNSSFPNSISSAKCSEVSLRFLPGSLSIDFGIPHSRVTKIIETPLNHLPSMEEPVVPRPHLEDIPFTDKSLELPTTNNTFDKHAVSMIRIRRKKMQKHKRRKLRKKMKYVWAKERNRRNQLRDKLFKEELLAKVVKAANFDAKAYVDSRIAAYTKERLPYTWRGEILPQAQIEEFVKERKRREHAKRNVPRLKL